MKMNKLIIIALVLVFSTFCSKQKEDQHENPINFNSIEVIKKNVTHFKELGKISKVITLETTDDSIIGTVYYAMNHEESGDILVGDYDSAKKVFRFNKNGRFITSYGKIGQGPGEYNHLKKFTSSPNGDVILLSTYKLLKYSQAGALLLEKRIDYFASDIAVIDDLIYVSVSLFRRRPVEKKSIVILNRNFEVIGNIGEYDWRLEKYSFIPTNFLAPRDGDLFFLDYYDLNLNVFKKDLQKVYKMSIPNDNKELDYIWNKKRLNEEDRRKIKDHLHRFSYIFSFNGGLILFEICKEKKIYNLWLFDPDKNKAIIFPYHSMCKDSDVKLQPNLFFDWIVGSYEKGVIGVLDSVEEFNKYKDNFPALKDISFKTGENPILVLFEFDMNKIEEAN